MAALIQQQSHVTAVRPQQESQQRKPAEDAALASFLNTKLRMDQASIYISRRNWEVPGHLPF